MKKKNLTENVKAIWSSLKMMTDRYAETWDRINNLDRMLSEQANRIDAIERIKSWDSLEGDSEAGGELAEKLLNIKKRAEEMREKITHVGLTSQSFADLDTYFFTYLGTQHVSAESKVFGLDLLPADEDYYQIDNDIQSRRTLL